MAGTESEIQVSTNELFRVNCGPYPPQTPFITEVGGVLQVNAHEQQFNAYNSDGRFTLIMAGTRSGKTAIGPYWLMRQMRERGPGEYLVCAPSYPLLKKAAFKAIRIEMVSRLRLGTIVGGPAGEFQFTAAGFASLFRGTKWEDEYDPEHKIVFGHAQNPDSLEGAEYKAAWLDECGQRFFLQESWEAIQRRLAMDEGPALMTTTPYMASGHWTIEEVYKPAKRRGTPAAQPEDEACRLFPFETIANPNFPRKEWERAMATMPKHRFDLFWRGILSKPAGLIYDCIEPTLHYWPDIDPEADREWMPPPEWKRYIGIDFGAPNFAAVFLAREDGYYELPGPTLNDEPIYLMTEDMQHRVPYSRYWVYDEYRPDVSRTAAEHVAEMRKIEKAKPEYVVGGSMSEGQWRSELKAAGLNVREPTQPAIEVMIDRTYGLFREGRLVIMKERCPRLIHDLETYSRPVDEHGEAMEGIVDANLYHSADALRYVCDFINRKSTGHYVGVA